ncbi:hypothetical protein V500_00408 [Pseudogymnoascus sp. VKM F-4518 (FW-2643)]|nr:hypothetical protein V500_00408 [Pseudogymnoascus sp. VKM F-4518 (FW-2643)]
MDPANRTDPLLADLMPTSSNLDHGVPLQAHESSQTQPNTLATSHDSNSTGQKRRRGAGRVGMSYARKRAVTACQHCRARKTKCDNQRPTCGFCASSDLDCQYEDRKDHSSFDPASLEMLDRLNRILEVQDNMLTVVETINMGMVRQSSPQASPATCMPSMSIPTTSPSASYPSNGIDLESQLPNEQVSIPSVHMIPDSILGWPIFEGRYPGKCLQEALFASARSCADNDEQTINDTLRHHSSKARAKYGFQEYEVAGLIQRFIDLVHIKNPILDEGMLKRMANRVVEDGLTWDGSSCLVLLACALGAIASPFRDAYEQATLDPQKYRNLPSLLSRSNMDKAEDYYALAQRRLGLLNQSMLACQCYFISGVYLMYSFQPLKAFQNFHQASIPYQIYSKSVPECTEDSKDNKLKQRLFWSCLKSECEILSEIELPQSGVAHLGYIHTFPQPPDSNSTDWGSTQTSAIITSSEVPLTASTTSPTYHSNPDDSLRREQQQSWFYYLSEIALRRIGNRVLNYFYQDGHESWAETSLRPITQAANEFLRQLDQWYACLPSSVRYNEENRSEIPSEELPYMLRTRALEIRSWILRPFLFQAIHSSTDSPYQITIRPWVDEAIRCCIQLIEANSLRHLHHGTWYTIRLSTTSALLLCASAKGGLAPNGWLQTVQLAIETLQFWENEGSGDSYKARLVLQELMDEFINSEYVT